MNKGGVFLLLIADMSLQERQRRYLSLSPWDKATLSLVRPKRAFHCSLNSHDLCVSSSCLWLSGSCDSLQQDGEDCCFLLHLVPALFGVPGMPVSGGAPGSLSSLFKELTCSLWSSFRCYTRPRGARVLAETALLSVLKSEIVVLFLQTLYVSHFSIVFVFPNRYADHLHQFHENDPNL